MSTGLVKIGSFLGFINLLFLDSYPHPCYHYGDGNSHQF